MASEYEFDPATMTGLAPWLTTDGDAMKRMHVAFEDWMETVLKIQEETAEFFQARFERNAKLAESLVECTDAQSLFDLQSKWLYETTEDYTRQAERFFERCVDGTKTCLESTVGETESETTAAPAAPAESTRDDGRQAA